MNIEIENLTFRYNPQVTALREVSLSIKAGEAVAIFGENGAGKSTLAKHLNGLLKPNQGSVHIGGWDTRQRTPAELANRVSYTFQNPDDQLFEQTVAKEISFGPRNLGLDNDQVHERVEQAMEMTGLSDQAETHPYDLHATERKFVALAAGLAMRTPIVVIDEPTTGQDARGQARLADILAHLKEDGRTLITISHDIDFCAAHFERAVLMANAQIIADRPMSDIFSDQDALTRSAIEPPQMVQLARRLDLAADPLTVEAFLEAYKPVNRDKD